MKEPTPEVEEPRGGVSRQVGGREDAATGPLKEPCVATVKEAERLEMRAGVVGVQQRAAEPFRIDRDERHEQWVLLAFPFVLVAPVAGRLMGAEEERRLKRAIDLIHWGVSSLAPRAYESRSSHQKVDGAGAPRLR